MNTFMENALRPPASKSLDLLFLPIGVQGFQRLGSRKVRTEHFGATAVVRFRD